MRAVRESFPKPLSASALSERTRALGHPVHRSVIAKLENGERASVTLADLFVLARALNVPPLTLLAPLTSADLVEVLPGKTLTTWEAIDWFNGNTNHVTDAVLGGESGAQDWYNATEAFELRQAYEVALSRFIDAQHRVERNEGASREAALAALDAEERVVESIRRQLSDLGVQNVPGDVGRWV